jgi:hypothetical protein
MMTKTKIDLRFTESLEKNSGDFFVYRVFKYLTKVRKVSTIILVEGSEKSYKYRVDTEYEI